MTASRFRLSLAVAVISPLLACGGRDLTIGADLPTVVVSVGQGRIEAPDSVRAGWTRLRVIEDGDGHIVVLFRLPASVSAGGVSSFLAILDTAVATPEPGVAMGGPEIGDDGEIVVPLTPGRYVLGCVRRGPDEHRHASAGESKTFLAFPGDSASTAAAPIATHSLSMIDFAYTGPEKWVAGLHLVRVENSGAQDHQLRLVRLQTGVTMKQWMEADDPETIATPIAGVARMGSGESAYLPVALSPGSYVAYCLIVDPKTHRPHVALGMLRAIEVERAGR